MQTPRVLIVVPCFNEERRLDRAELVRLARSEGLGLVLVDDGSTDGTRAALEAIRGEAPDRVAVLALDRNRGKAEAVRAGLREALRAGAAVVGYADADLSTPVDELRRMAEEMAARPVAVLLGSRVRLLGTSIDRRPARHYLGRVFATAASVALGLPVYDTQCGAKLLARTPALAAALERPFRSRWIFDVELLARLLDGGPGAPALRPEDLRELPLRAWCDVSGSKLRPGAMLWAGLELLGLLVRRRRAGGRRPARAAVDAAPGPR